MEVKHKIYNIKCIKLEFEATRDVTVCSAWAPLCKQVPTLFLSFETVCLQQSSSDPIIMYPFGSSSYLLSHGRVTLPRISSEI